MTPGQEPAGGGKSINVVHLVVIAVAAVIWLVVAAQAYFHPHPGASYAEPTPNPKSSIFHVPTGGCPAGTEQRSAVFEKDKREIPGCINPQGDGSIDFIRPGESFGINILPLESPASQGPRAQV
jgi:hypothetical protein